jgi:membrane protein YqaA with SNARE-associated domain
MIEKMYDWMMKQAESKNAVPVLIFISFIESSFFPLPPDPILGIVVAKNKDKAWYCAGICALASVIGGFFGYYIGYAFFDLIGSKIIAHYWDMSQFNALAEKLNRWAFWLICAKGLTPIPYKIVTIASGFAHIDIVIFGVASLITRTTRFVVLSFICKKFGEQFLKFIEEHKKIALSLIIISVIVGFLLLKLFMM